MSSKTLVKQPPWRLTNFMSSIEGVKDEEELRRILRWPSDREQATKAVLDLMRKEGPILSSSVLIAWEEGYIDIELIKPYFKAITKYFDGRNMVTTRGAVKQLSDLSRELGAGMEFIFSKSVRSQRMGIDELCGLRNLNSGSPIPKAILLLTIEEWRRRGNKIERLVDMSIDGRGIEYAGTYVGNCVDIMGPEEVDRVVDTIEAVILGDDSDWYSLVHIVRSFYGTDIEGLQGILNASGERKGTFAAKLVAKLLMAAGAEELGHMVAGDCMDAVDILSYSSGEDGNAVLVTFLSLERTGSFLRGDLSVPDFTRKVFAASIDKEGLSRTVWEQFGLRDKTLLRPMIINGDIGLVREILTHDGLGHNAVQAAVTREDVRGNEGLRARCLEISDGSGVITALMKGGSEVQSELLESGKYTEALVKVVRKRPEVIKDGVRVPGAVIAKAMTSGSGVERKNILGKIKHWSK